MEFFNGAPWWGQNFGTFVVTLFPRTVRKFSLGSSIIFLKLLSFRKNLIKFTKFVTADFFREC